MTALWATIAVLIVAGVALAVVVSRRDRRGGATGDRPAETHKAGWLHKPEGM